MNKKFFNRKNIFLYHFLGSITVMIISVIIFLITYEIKSWRFLGASLTFFSVGLLEFTGYVINREHDIIIDYDKKEIISNSNLNKNGQNIIQFNSIVDAYIYNVYQLKDELQLKKYPKETLVIEKKYHQKEYIPLNKFDENVKEELLIELLKERDNYEKNL